MDIYPPGSIIAGRYEIADLHIGDGAPVKRVDFPDFGELDTDNG